MVRHKARWILVQVDFSKQHDNKNTSFPSKKEFALMIRQSISSCFGVAADGAAMETQVRFVNSTTRLVLLRVPREFCNMVRCSITMLTRNIADDVAAIAATTTKDDSMTGSSTKRALAQLDRRPTLVASVISVNGSARTAKLSTMARIRKVYRQRILENDKDPKLVEELHSLLSLVQNID
ncbi:unnamed protein product [Cylindrotheca closterium]|uniref:Uncharacterized protein n=1 Tax=Cylindrotheca closterium TaxID=2856 RepID=A0AAD2FKY4_9STRA|nr:unnamed protein product [Cylindrotheca closterium]